MEKCARWLTDKYIAFMLLVFPLWTGLEGYASITLSKFLVFAAAALIWLVSLGVCAIRYRYLPKKPDAASICALAFMTAAIISALLSPYRDAVLLGSSRYDGLITLLLYGAIFLGVSRWGEVKEYYVDLIALASSLCCAVAVLQILGNNPLSLYPAGLCYADAGIKYSGAFLGTLGNVDVLAAYLCLCIPILLYSALKGANLPRRALYLLAALLCTAVLIISDVASGAVALCGAAVVALISYVNFKHPGRRTLIISLAALALIAAAALLLIYLAPPQSGTLWELSRILHGDIRDSFGSSRVRIWREAAALIAERPLIGGGPDTLSLRSNIEFSRYVEETGRTLTSRVDNAHCEPLGYLVNIGLLGLLPYLALCCAAARKCVKGAARGFGIAAACYFIQSLFGLGLCFAAPLFWIYLGIICADAAPKAAKAKKP